MSFKLLAIRPMPGTDPKFLKNLKPGVIYKFYQEYQFLDKDGNDLSEFEYFQKTGDGLDEKHFLKDKNGSPLPAETKVIKVKPYDNPSVPENLYSQERGPSINISAVVGKNGSGKSSLVELFYRYIYDLSILELNKRSDPSEKCIDLEKEKEDHDKLLEINNKEKIIKPADKEYELELKRSEESFDLQYEIEKIEKLIDDKKTLDTSYLEVFVEYSSNEDNENICIKKLTFENNSFPFYNVALNHSAYSLNSSLIGNWIEKIFHKNDGYETPIVINPMRTEGDIEINNELHLIRSRLLLNTEITKTIKKEIESVIFSRKNEINDTFFTLNEQKITKIRNKDHSKRKESLKVIQILAKNLSEYYDDLASLDLTNYDVVSLNDIPDNSDKRKKKVLLKVLYEYLLNKIAKYATHKKIVTRKYNSIEFELNKVLNLINKDFTHQTFKFYQILHLLKNDNFEAFFKLAKNSPIDEGLIEIKIKETDFKDYLEDFKFIKGITENEILKVPGAFFSSDFTFKNEAEFSKMSSGEVQILNSLNTIIYHLRNIESIEGSYEHVNLIFDEVELYFHVDYQRVFISKLLEAIKISELKRIKNINIQFLTHSPFILSDIPSQNILRLEDGKPVKAKNDTNSFAANIHDLLADEFFLEDGFMGEFAKGKINEFLIYYHEVSLQKMKNEQIDTTELKEKIKYFSKIIELIGDPVYKTILLNNISYLNAILKK